MLRGIVQRNGSQRLVLAFAAIVVLCLLCPPLLAQEWEIEVLDSGRQLGDVSDRSIRVDALGHPHIAYGGDVLRYAWHDGAAWHYEVADSSCGVDAASLALDAAGVPHVSYCDSTHGNLMYAYRTASGWHAEVVGMQSDENPSSSIALDASGHPHIAYNDGMFANLRYAREDETGWHIQNVDEEGSMGSLALDTYGYPRISYRAGASPPFTLGYAYEDAEGWHFQTVDSVGTHGGASSLAVGTDGFPHISYYDHAPDNALKYAHFDATGWHIQTVDIVGYHTAANSLMLDVSGSPCIAYTWDYHLKFACLIGSTWHTETVDQDDGVWGVSLVLDSLGDPHIEYSKVEGNDLILEYARPLASGPGGRVWHLEIVDTSRDVGQLTCLALDGSGNPHVSYWTGSPSSGGTLHYMRQDGSLACGQAVAPQASEYACTSLSLDGSDSPHIAFKHSSSLKYAYADADGWQVQTVGSLEYGWDASLALGNDGYARVSYGRMSPQPGLRFAYEDETGWHLETVDPGAARFTSLAIDSSGQPHISYYSIPSADLRYAYEDSAGWHIETVVAQGDVGRYSSLALDALGFPHICHARYDDFPRLKYAYRDATGWHGEDADFRGCEYISLALDAQGRPHVSYYADRDLRFVFRDTEGWHTQIVDSQGDVGRYTSLALDSDGCPHITYYDLGTHSLKYARMAGLPAQDDPFLPLRITAVDVWPNPARGVVHARLGLPEGQGMVRLTVVDLLGRRMMSLQQLQAIGPEATFTLRLPELIPTGQYFLGVEGDGSKQFVPITVVK